MVHTGGSRAAPAHGPRITTLRSGSCAKKRASGLHYSCQHSRLSAAPRLWPLLVRLCSSGPGRMPRGDNGSCRVVALRWQSIGREVRLGLQEGLVEKEDAKTRRACGGRTLEVDTMAGGRRCHGCHSVDFGPQARKFPTIKLGSYLVSNVGMKQYPCAERNTSQYEMYVF
jgi:hypothetical protein